MLTGDIARLGAQVTLSHLFRTAPLEVGWDVTYRCNAKCTYCTNWTTDYPNMPLDKVAKLVARVKRLGTFQMSLSGGEPLMRKDIVDIVKMIKGAGMRCSMVSNGVISREPLFRALMEAGLDSITFSMDGSTKESHERFRHGTNFEKLLKSIETCVALQKEGFHTRISTNTVLTNSNVDEIPKIAALVRNLGLTDFKFQPVWKQHYVKTHLAHAEQTDDFNVQYGFTNENAALLARAVDEIRDAKSSNDPDFTELIPDFYEGTEKARGIPCFAGRAFIFIDADGGVHPCGKVDHLFGNLLDDAWEDDPSAMFETPEAQKVKHDLAKQSCGGCAAVAYMERNILMNSVKRPSKLLQIVARRVLR